MFTVQYWTVRGLCDVMGRIVSIATRVLFLRNVYRTLSGNADFLYKCFCLWYPWAGECW